MSGDDHGDDAMSEISLPAGNVIGTASPAGREVGFEEAEGRVTTVEEGADDDVSETNSEFHGPNADPAKAYSEQTLSLLIPVSITMLIVMGAIQLFTPLINPEDQQPAYLVYQEKTSDTTGTKLTGALLNSLVMVVLVIVVTFVLLLFYKYRCYRVIGGWLVFSSFLLLGSMSWMWLDLFCVAFQIPYDFYSVILLSWNYAVVGVITIFWRGTKLMTQVYLVSISCMMGWFLSRLPEWTTWILLASIAIYDVFAVLTPRGPLKLLLEESQRRNEPIPALIYESKKFKLGLGDFIFYAVLVGRAAMYSYLAFAVCFLAILMGLCATLLCLGIFRTALPALPISISLGIVFYFLTRYLLAPYIVDLTLMGVWI